MECLTEANKVATLARRRENPKPLPGSALAPPAAERRVSFAFEPFHAGVALRPRFSARPRDVNLRQAPELSFAAGRAPASARRGANELKIRPQAHSEPRVRAARVPAGAAKPPAAGAFVLSVNNASAGGLRISAGTAFRPGLPGRDGSIHKFQARAPLPAASKRKAVSAMLLPVGPPAPHIAPQERRAFAEFGFGLGQGPAQAHMEWTGTSDSRE